MNIDFKEWQANLLRGVLAEKVSKLNFMIDVRKMIKKFRSEINQRKFKEMLDSVFSWDARPDGVTYVCYSYIPLFVASLILQRDMSVLKDICIDEHNCIREYIFKYCSFDEFSNKKLGFDVSKVEIDAFEHCKAKKIDINTKGELFLSIGCFKEIKSNCVINVSASDDIFLCHEVFENSNLHELKLEAANKIYFNMGAICNSTIDTLIIDTKNLDIDGDQGVKQYLNMKYNKEKRRWWNSSINRLVISKEIIDQWGEEKILKLFRPNILEIL